MGMRKETEREAGRPGTRIARPLPSPVTRLRGHRDRLAVALTVGAALVFVPAVAAETKPRPCAAHPVQAAPGKVDRAECLRAYKRQRARDRMQFPPSPTRRDVEKRVPDWRGFVRLGRCEQPGNGKYGVNWSHQGPTWGGGLGIYKTSWNIANSPYKRWSGSMVETILVADAIRDRYSIKSAWGAWRCFYA